MPLWVPNPVDSMILFVFEALIVLSLAIAAVAFAAFALWVA